MRHQAIAAFLLVLSSAFTSVALGAATTRASVDSSGTQSNGASWQAAISADGRYVAFASEATNLVASDTNGVTDVFLHDRQTGTTTRVSVSSTGTQADGASYAPSITADGQHVAFTSDATNLVAGDTNGASDVFIHDVGPGVTTRVSVDSSGTQANGDSSEPAISGDGWNVAFSSSATNLVAGDTNGCRDVFLHHTSIGTTTRVSLDSSGTEGNAESRQPALSTTGRYVAFHSAATNLVAGDANSANDVFVRDAQLSTTTRASVDTSGGDPNGASLYPSISGDGRYVAFESLATDLVTSDTNSRSDVFVRDRQGSSTTRVSLSSGGAQGDGDSTGAAISSDGAYVAFISEAANLVASDSNGATDVFRHVVSGSTIARISVSSAGAQANNVSDTPVMDSDGSAVAFPSYATNLVAGDSNGTWDTFVWDHDGVAPTYKVDGMIHNGTTYIGDEVFSSTGAGQTHERTVVANSTATYYVQFYNDGNVADTFSVTGSAGNVKWTVQYLEYWSSTDVTSQVTGGGWQSSAIAAGSYCRLKVLVTPLSAATGGTVFSAYVKATSQGDATKADTVRAATTCTLVRKVDGLIHDGTAYIGDEIINNTGDGQTATRLVPSNTAAIFNITYYNEGNVPDTYRITGAAGNARWSVQYLEHWSGTDITSQVTGAGWDSTALMPGAGVRVRVVMTPLSTALGGSTYSTLVTATSLADNTKRDGVKAQTTCELTRKVDGQIHTGTAWIGDEIINATGDGQATAKSVGNGAAAQYLAIFYNEGNAADALNITGPAGNSKWTIQYQEYWSGTDVTADVTGAGWQPGAMVPGANVRMQVLVTPTASATGGSSQSVVLLATSANDATKRDAVKAVTTCTAAYQPDGLILSGGTYIGDGIYNATGAGQTATASVALGASATYYPRFVNDGNVAESLKLTGTAGNSKWTVAYYEYYTNADLTAAVTGGGFTTAVLSPGGSVRLKVVVTPGASTAVGNEYSLLLTGASTTLTAKTDTVGMVTTRQ